MNSKQEERERLLSEKAYALFDSYRRSYQREWQRLEKNERLYRGDSWFDVPMEDRNEPRPTTPILQSTVECIAAELMEQCPEAVILPQGEGDEEKAALVEALIKRNHDVAAYAGTYKKLVHDLLVGGYCIQEVGYDASLNQGLGGAFIRQVDNRSILFDPLCEDIQEGRGVIKFSLRSTEWLQSRYPDKAVLSGEDRYLQGELPMDELLQVDRRGCRLLLEYWWKTPPDKEGRQRVHMALLCGGQVLEDSRRQKPEGYFAHGLYPFILTPLYIRKGSALGFGVIDLYEKQQRFGDKLDQIVLKNALMASRNKLLLTEASGFDEEDLKDWSKEVHKGESLNGISWFATAPLPAYILNYIDRLRQTVKEESGANDSSRGNYPSGVTAASAIIALQNASGKRSRMAAEQLYEGFRQAVRMELEVEREFNFYPRPLFLGGRWREFSMEWGEYPMEFAISIKAQKQSPYQALMQNELMLQLLQLGAMNAQQAVSLMHFEGKEQVLKVMGEAVLPTKKDEGGRKWRK